MRRQPASSTGQKSREQGKQTFLRAPLVLLDPHSLSRWRSADDRSARERACQIAKRPQRRAPREQPAVHAGKCRPRKRHRGRTACPDAARADRPHGVASGRGRDADDPRVRTSNLARPGRLEVMQRRHRRRSALPAGARRAEKRRTAMAPGTGGTLAGPARRALPREVGCQARAVQTALESVPTLRRSKPFPSSPRDARRARRAWLKPPAHGARGVPRVRRERESRAGRAGRGDEGGGRWGRRATRGVPEDRKGRTGPRDARPGRGPAWGLRPVRCPDRRSRRPPPRRARSDTEPSDACGRPRPSPTVSTPLQGSSERKPTVGRACDRVSPRSPRAVGARRARGLLPAALARRGARGLCVARAERPSRRGPSRRPEPPRPYGASLPPATV